jgi:predicted RNase H-like HicB family nuclease
MAQASHPAFNLDVLLYREDGAWQAHCLQLDLVEVGATAEEAEQALVDVIRAHIEYALADNDMEHLFSPAPPEVWRQFWAAETQGPREIPLAVPSERQPAPRAVTVQRATVSAVA